jgi:hypothetical protein
MFSLKKVTVSRRVQLKGSAARKIEPLLLAHIGLATGAVQPPVFTSKIGRSVLWYFAQSPGASEVQPMALDLDGRENLFIPTVYLMWAQPDIKIKRVFVDKGVYAYITDGADLFLPVHMNR